MPDPEREALRLDLAAEWEAVERALAHLDRVGREEPGPLEVRGAASVLHDFYNGLESIFTRIAVQVDRNMPEGPHWHVDLLRRMTRATPGLRPALLDEDLAEELEEFLRFRHLFRHTYGFRLRWERIRLLLERLPGVAARCREALDGFGRFLAEG